jgi:flagellar hook-basal body complex protein FliE
MTINPATAANAYATTAQLGGSNQSASAGQKAAGDVGAFSDLVTQAVGSVAESGQAAEAKAVGLASGQTEIVDLVTAVAETELAMETLVTVRDRVISAYQDIINMPI